MDTIQFITILGSVVGSFIYIIKELRSFETEMRADSVRQSQRTDKLYEMFIQVLNDKKV